MKDITLLEKVESPSQSCEKCYYYQSDSDGGNECCARPLIINSDGIGNNKSEKEG